jgi:hypothetical protein
LFLEFFSRRGLFYAKMPNLHIYIFPPSGNPFGEALEPQGDLESKKGKNKLLLKFFLGGVYFMHKCQISIFIFHPLQAAHLGRP